jgi:hypothetical protein
MKTRSPENLTRYQATLLQQLPLSLENLKKKKQTTIRWCFKRGLLDIQKGLAQRTEFGDACLAALIGSNVDRKESIHYGDFTQVIRHLVDVARYERVKAREERKLQIVHRRVSAAA